MISSILLIYEGVQVNPSTLFFIIISQSKSGFIISSSDAMATVRPFKSPIICSPTDTSKVRAASASITLQSMVNTLTCTLLSESVARFTIPRCSTITPFGLPVEPEVYKQ